METPLDVLSRAASLVETSDSNRECLYKRTPPPPPLDDRESPSRELPSKLFKHDRIKDRQELSHTLNFDKDHAARLNSKKSAGTQTQFSSFNGENYPYYPHEGVPADSSYSLRPLYPPPPPPPPLPPRPSHEHRPRVSSPEVDMSSPDIQNAPLNLSLSSGGSPLQRHSLRPSVITCTTTSPSNTISSHQYGQCSTPEELPSPSQAKLAVSDPAIEEHFRRSLGQSYSDTMQTKTTTSTVTTATAVQANVSITGSVDDHFAKSLGDTTWTAIKAKSDPVRDMFSGSVDDHFAKALGDTWLRIKAEKENNCHSSTCSSPSGSPQHTSVVTT